MDARTLRTKTTVGNDESEIETIRVNTFWSFLQYAHTNNRIVNLPPPANRHVENQLASGEEWGNTLPDASFIISTVQNPLAFPILKHLGKLKHPMPKFTANKLIQSLTLETWVDHSTKPTYPVNIDLMRPQWATDEQHSSSLPFSPPNMTDEDIEAKWDGAVYQDQINVDVDK
ncbi:hypothetical protein FACUT_2829 [Fusarium acutatum]|uniref:Uncharacterized protein n=1 Tax=Fusarium acutatum TaxID=78861 RepID=A0A8H4K0M3_9HYPO|nr:hypothetical protein FACUT_2829 [Fusarium acutatum]